jgi:hypothetical protein
MSEPGTTGINSPGSSASSSNLCRMRRDANARVTDLEGGGVSKP